MKGHRLKTLIIPALAASLFLAHAAHYRAYVNDDADITFRYACNLAVFRYN